MVRIAPIKLQYNPKTLWFDANGIDVHKDDAVVVSTARGTEFGHATDDVFEGSEEEVKKLKTELKPVERLATDEDVEKAAEMMERSKEAFPVFKEMASETSDEMHPVSVEFLLDGEKAVFYFEAEERVDFRELVRKLASKFHVRIDMRQIGVRDEARIVGGLGHCGQELCCKRLGGEFNPVSIRMAKEQDLSLNPQKISGVCGRLMCCLRYEFDAYKDFKDRAPKINAKIETPEGIAKVIDLNVPKEIITLKLDDDKQVKIPLDEMEPVKKGERPSKVSKQAFERFANQDIFTTFDSISFPSFAESSLFSDSSQGKSSSSRLSMEQSEKTRKPRRRTKVSKENKSETGQATKSENRNTESSQKKRPTQRKRRRSSTVEIQKSQNAKQHTPQNTQSKSRQENQKTGQKKNQSKQGPRPGQRSSGLRKEGTAPAKEKKKSTASKPIPSDGSPSGRTRRRRSHKADTGGAN